MHPYLDVAQQDRVIAAVKRALSDGASRSTHGNQRFNHPQGTACLLDVHTVNGLRTRSE
jgi:hypothetical protein